jgi:hypothetical protein
VENGEIRVVRESSMCRNGIGFKRTELFYRKMAALDYIRANYCKGQPEPAPQSRKPY